MSLRLLLVQYTQQASRRSPRCAEGGHNAIRGSAITCSETPYEARNYQEQLSRGSMRHSVKRQFSGKESPGASVCGFHMRCKNFLRWKCGFHSLLMPPRERQERI